MHVSGTIFKHNPSQKARPCLSETKSPHTRSPAGQQSTGKPVIVDVIRILIAIILPPVGVFLQVGLGLHFWLNILLTLCGYVPGIIHAIWVIVRR